MRADLGDVSVCTVGPVSAVVASLVILGGRHSRILPERSRSAPRARLTQRLAALGTAPTPGASAFLIGLRPALVTALE